MEFLLQFLPVVIYLLLIGIIIIGIILGIKLIITIDKVDKIIDDVNAKIERVTPLFDSLGMISDKVGGFFATVISTIESIVTKIFTKSDKKRKKESEIDEQEW